MFKVIHAESKKAYTVYAVIVEDGRTMFLFWDYGWKWEDADDYLLLHEINAGVIEREGENVNGKLRTTP